MQVSFILPVRNEYNYIALTLDSVLSQNTTKNYEVIISEGGSTDGTLDIINQYVKKYPEIKLIHNPNQIVSTGFNTALNEAFGDIIIRIDGHCEIQPNYLERCVELINKQNANIVGGSIQTISNGLIGHAIAVAQSCIFGVGNVKFRQSNYNHSGHVDTLAFGAHKREIFVRIGGYDEEMIYNQDDEFNFRAIQAGEKIYMDPTIKTKYFARSNYSKLFKQYFNYGIYKVRGIQKRKQLFSYRHLIPFVFIISLFSTIFYGLYFNNPIISIIVLLPYIIGNCIFSIITSPSIQAIPFLFFSFWTLHLGYGLGLTWGLIRFIGKWNDTSLKDHHFNKEQFLSNDPVFSK